jgi:hypothetical protein
MEQTNGAIQNLILQHKKKTNAKMDRIEEALSSESRSMNEDIGKWTEKFCDEQVSLTFNKVPNPIEYRGKDEVLHALKQFSECTRFEFNSVHSDTSGSAFSVTGKLYLKNSPSAQTVVDIIHTDPETRQITSITRFTNFTRISDAFDERNT